MLSIPIIHSFGITVAGTLQEVLGGEHRGHSFSTTFVSQFYRAGSGIALHVENLSALSLQLGPNTTAPTLNVGLSVNYGAFTTIALKNGTNVIPLTSNSTVVATHGPSSSVIRLKVEVCLLLSIVCFDL